MTPYARPSVCVRLADAILVLARAAVRAKLARPDTLVPALRLSNALSKFSLRRARRNAPARLRRPKLPKRSIKG